MTGRQRTFELVPTTLVKQNAAKPPMTSKAAKKAYQQAQKGPRISKAEQRRRDAEEYERIRKENEKERNAAKAKAARDKKAAKALAEKEGRKKLGLPEPSRFVRASQPTISKFVRTDSSAKRSWKEMSVTEETEDPVSDSEGDDAFETIPSAKRIAVEHESEDEFGDFPQLSPSALDKIDSSAASFSAPPSPEKKKLDEATTRPQPSPEHQETRKREERSESTNTTNMANTGISSKAAEKVPKEHNVEPLAFPPPPPIIGPQKLPDKDIFVKPLDRRDNTEPTTMPILMPPPSSISVSRPRPVLQERSNNMPPPRLPMKKPSTSFTGPLSRPQTSHHNSSRVLPKLMPNMPPSATQAFLEDHIDDFFPSPSQQVRELLDEIDDIPSNTQIAREITPQQPAAIDQPEYFICTQDFVLTPQDLEEIITPSRVQPTAPTTSTSKGAKPPANRPVSRDKPRFFEEKEDDLFQAALHESRPTRSRRTRKELPTAASNSAVSTAQSKAQPRRFFEEKEEDVLSAVLHESKISAAKQTKSKKLSAPPLRKESSATDYGNFDFKEFFEGEEQKIMQAALEESKRTAALERQAALEVGTKMASLKKQEAPVKEPSKRTLKRALSSATDYGEDELNGCSQELLALC